MRCCTRALRQGATGVPQQTGPGSVTRSAAPVITPDLKRSATPVVTKPAADWLPTRSRSNEMVGIVGYKSAADVIAEMSYFVNISR